MHLQQRKPWTGEAGTLTERKTHDIVEVREGNLHLVENDPCKTVLH